MMRAARQALADVVVGVAFELEASCPRGMKAPKLWPAEPVKCELDRVRRAGPPGRSARVISLPSDRADDAVDVADRQLGAHRLAALEGRRAQRRAASSCRATCPGRGPAASCSEAADLVGRRRGW